MNIQKKLENYLDKPIAQAADKEIYGGLLTIVQEMASVKERTDSKKKVYYISAESLGSFQYCVHGLVLLIMLSATDLILAKISSGGSIEPSGAAQSILTKSGSFPHSSR